MYFVDRDGDRIEVVAKVGSSLLDVAIDNDIELEGIFITTSNDQLSLSIKCLYELYIVLYVQFPCVKGLLTVSIYIQIICGEVDLVIFHINCSYSLCFLITMLSYRS